MSFVVHFAAVNCPFIDHQGTYYVAKVVQGIKSRPHPSIHLQEQFTIRILMSLIHFLPTLNSGQRQVFSSSTIHNGKRYLKVHHRYVIQRFVPRIIVSFLVCPSWFVASRSFEATKLIKRRHEVDAIRAESNPDCADPLCSHGIDVRTRQIYLALTESKVERPFSR